MNSHMTYADIDVHARRELTPDVACAIQEFIDNGQPEQVALSNDGIGVIWFDSLSHMIRETGIDHVVTFSTFEEFENIRTS